MKQHAQPVSTATSVDPFPAALSPTTDRLIDLRLVQDRCGRISRTTVWRLMRDADFPRPTAVGARHLWSDHEVSTWIARRLANRPGTR